MFSILSTLWSKVYGYIIAAGAILAGLITVYVLGSKDGKHTAETDVLKDRLKAREDKDAVSDQVQQMDDDSVISEFDRLHESRRKR